jgi:hypothetical protein
VSQRPSPRRSPERMDIDVPLPVPVPVQPQPQLQPQLHHQPPQPPSQPLQQVSTASPRPSAEPLRHPQLHSQPQQQPQPQRPAFTQLPSSSHTHNTHSQSTETPTPRSEILSSALYTPGPPREQQERNHQYPFPNASLSTANGMRLVHPTPQHVQSAQPTPQVLQMEVREVSLPPVARRISGPLQVQQHPQLVHWSGESAPQAPVPRPAAPVSVDFSSSPQLIKDFY